MKPINVQASETAGLPSLVSRYQREQTQPDSLNRRQYLLLVYHSTALDGHALTPDQIELLGEEEGSKSDRTREEMMVLDYGQGQKLITDWATDHEPLSLANVQELGACVMRHTGGIIKHFLSLTDSAQGELRTHELSGAGGFYERPPKN